MRTEVWRDCRNVKGGWRCVTEHGQELFIRYPADYAEQFKTGPARVPEACYGGDGGLNWRSMTPK